MEEYRDCLKTGTKSESIIHRLFYTYFSLCVCLFVLLHGGNLRLINSRAIQSNLNQHHPNIRCIRWSNLPRLDG